MTYIVKISKRIPKELSKITKTERERIIEKIKRLSGTPGKVAQKLKGRSDFLKVRVGDYRLIIRILEKKREVHVIFVGHRSKVYDDLSKLKTL